jgi:lipoic acid synthetase
MERKPQWLKIKLANTAQYFVTRDIVEKRQLHTICSSGKCPNIGQCWSMGTATFMILGDICTRSCKFCATTTGKPLPPDLAEPDKIAESIRLMQLKHSVITSVDRDDLADKGANHWADTIRVVRTVNPDIIIEVLIPDFDGRLELLDMVIAAQPTIIGHNLETVERLTPHIRSRAKYRLSLEVLKYVAGKNIIAKTGIMLGLGETPDEVMQTMLDARNAGVSLFTIGQYLQPTSVHIPVQEYVHPTQFELYKKEGEKLEFSHIESGPLVRSSYMAEKNFSIIKNKQDMIFTDWGTIDYKEAWDRQRALAEQVVAEKQLPETIAQQIIFCEHPHVYTLGRNGKANNLLINDSFLAEINATYYQVDRGGDITYHGPGQIVAYPILDLERLHLGLKQYVFSLEEIVIQALSDFGITAGRLDGATGVWLAADKPEAQKICAIGVHASRFVTTHGFALNVNTDLGYYRHINPCGFVDKSVTSMQQELGQQLNIEEVKNCLKKYFLLELKGGNKI